MSQPLWIRSYRLAFAALAVAAIIAKYVTGEDSPGNFLSLFTIQSNAFAAVVLLAGALGPASGSRRRDLLRGAAVMYMVTTGIVYGLLINGFDNPFTSGRSWTHTVLHQVMPIVMVLDLIVRPLAHRLPWRDALWWTIYPIGYLAYSLVRGPIVGWYPYTFIDPHEVGGYGGVALYALGITAGFLLIAAVVVWLSRTLRPGPGARAIPGDVSSRGAL